MPCLKTFVVRRENTLRILTKVNFAPAMIPNVRRAHGVRGTAHDTRATTWAKLARALQNKRQRPGPAYLDPRNALGWAGLEKIPLASEAVELDNISHCAAETSALSKLVSVAPAQYAQPACTKRAAAHKQIPTRARHVPRGKSSTRILMFSAFDFDF